MRSAFNALRGLASRADSQDWVYASGAVCVGVGVQYAAWGLAAFGGLLVAPSVVDWIAAIRSVKGK